MTQNGKAIKARRIGGVKMVPKWNWSREYAREVAKHNRALSRPFCYSRTWVPHRHNKYLETLYRAWLFSDRKISFEDAQELIRQQRQAA